MTFNEWIQGCPLSAKRLGIAEAAWDYAYHKGAYDKEIECTERMSKDYAERDERIKELEQKLADTNSMLAEWNKPVPLSEWQKMEQQLAEREKQNVMLRGALKEIYEHGLWKDRELADEALDATHALKDCIICDAEPVGKYRGKESEYGYEVIQLDCDVEEGTRLYRRKA